MSSFTSVSPQGPAGDAAAEPGPGEAPRDSTHPHTHGNLADFLRNHTTDAVATLGQLVRLGPQSLPRDRLGQPAGLLPVAALQACQAIMFMRTTKGGLGLSYSHGSGFLINKLDTEYDTRGGGDRSGRNAAGAAAGGGGGSWGGGYGLPSPTTVGAAASMMPSVPMAAAPPPAAPPPGGGAQVPIIRWSAPCFYSIDSLSVGLTVGIEHTHSVLLLWNDATLERVKTGRAVLGTDVHVMVGQRAEAEDSSGDPAGGDPGGPHLGFSGVGGGGGGLVRDRSGSSSNRGVGGGFVGGLSLGGIELPLPQHTRSPSSGFDHRQAHDRKQQQPPSPQLQPPPPQQQHHHHEGHLQNLRIDQAEELLGELQLEQDEEAHRQLEEKQHKALEGERRRQQQQQKYRHAAPAGPGGGEEEEEEEAGEGTVLADGGVVTTGGGGRGGGAGTTAATTISTYTVHDGALLDFSLLGGVLHPDNRHNRAVYGEGVTPDDILYGRVAPPEEFGPLYSTLRMLTAKTRQQLAAL